MKAKKTTCRVCVIGDRWGKGGRDRLSGVLRFAAEHPDWSVAVVTLGTPGDTHKLKQILASGKTDHLIMLSCDKTAAAFAAEAQAKHLISGETMTVDLNPSYESQIAHRIDLRLDATAIARESIRLLLRRGYANIAYVGHASERHFSDPRRDELRRIAEADGIPFAATDDTDDIERLANWLRALPRPCGVITYCDLRSRDVLDACHLTQLRVPEQIGIIGSDDDASICEAMVPTLTSVLPDFESSSYRATEAFYALIRQGRRARKTQHLVYGVKGITERESTMDFRGGGLLVSTAREFIRTHVSDQLTVQTIADHCRVSRRLLELRFREINECSVRDEIERMRLAAVCKLLRETKLPLGDIARRVGFSSHKHLCTVFAKKFSCTMRTYRHRA